MLRTALLVALIAFTAGCKRKIDPERLEKDLSEWIAQKGFTMTVTCPKHIDIKKDETFTCEAKGEDGELPIEVTMTNDKGAVTSRIPGTIIDTRTVIERYEKKHPEAKFSCAKRLVVLKKVGDTTSCDATAGDQKGKVIVTLDNEQHGWKAELKLD